MLVEVKELESVLDWDQRREIWEKESVDLGMALEFWEPELALESEQGWELELVAALGAWCRWRR